MANRNHVGQSNSGASQITPRSRRTPSGEQLIHVLQAIVEKVESSGPDGCWLSRSSATIGEARIALQKAAFDKEYLDVQCQEAALRDLVWRVEHVRDALSADAAGQELAALLDTSQARAALGLGPGAGGAPETAEGRAGTDGKK